MFWTVLLILLSLFLPACTSSNRITTFVKEGGLETKGLVNLALASNGARVTVSQDSEDGTATRIIDGITSWEQGGGWEANYEGFLARGEYIGYGVEDPMVVMERVRNRNRDDDDSVDFEDPRWRGLRIETRYGQIDTAMGWVIIEFPEEKLVNRAIIYTVDSDKYPADKYGVADVTIQYWSSSAKSWASVNRVGKEKGQAANAVQDNKKGIINVRFEPVTTTRMRFVIRWTNDAKKMRRGYYDFVTGTIRIAEIEIYGYEKQVESIVQAKSVGLTQDANKTAEIQVILDNYVDAYNRRNINMLMSSISADYESNGDRYEGLKKRMESTFATYDHIKLELSDIKVNLMENSATVISKYKLSNKSSSDASLNIERSGTLKFTLTSTQGVWRITGIQSF